MRYRPNVGICLINSQDLIFGGKRTNLEFLPKLNDTYWQMPQGGVKSLDNEEILIKGMYRELWEEIGLNPKHVEILKRSAKIKYDFDSKVMNSLNQVLYGNIVGQEQIWFYLKFLGTDTDICLTNDICPEFSEWRWCTADFLRKNVTPMKAKVYSKILCDL